MESEDIQNIKDGFMSGFDKGFNAGFEQGFKKAVEQWKEFNSQQTKSEDVKDGDSVKETKYG